MIDLSKKTKMFIARCVAALAIVIWSKGRGVLTDELDRGNVIYGWIMNGDEADGR